MCDTLVFYYECKSLQIAEEKDHILMRYACMLLETAIFVSSMAERIFKSDFAGSIMAAD